MSTETPIRIPLIPVESSNLAAIGYDDAKQILAVQFRSGHVHHYASVAPDTALALLAADSKGKFYVATVRGRYEAARMTGVCADCGAIGWLGESCGDCGCGPYVDNRQTVEELAPLDARD